MSTDYQPLLDAAIRHLEGLRNQGTRFVPVTEETWTALRKGAAPKSALRPGTPAVAPVRASAPQVAAPSAPTPIPVLTAVSSPVVAPPAGAMKEQPPGHPERAVAMEALQQRALVCVKCPNLASSRTQVVFGVGDIQASVMFVGEAPGVDEDAQGEPFVGAAGQLLTRIIQTMGFSRESVYIANILKCRPDTPGQASGNRKPTTEEMKTCIPYLHSQIDLIQPKVLVALGGTAVEGLLGKTEGITRLRGNWREYRGIPLMPTFHPSYLLRNQALSEKRKVWEDMLQVLERLGQPISDKQRAYFLRS